VESNGGSLENVAKVFVLFLCGVQLVLRSDVLTILDFDKVDVTPRFAEVFGSVLSGVGGSTGGWWCCWGAPSLPQLPPATPKNPPPCSSLLFLCFCRDWSNQHNIVSGRLEVNLSLSEKRGGKSRLGTILQYDARRARGTISKGAVVGWLRGSVRSKDDSWLKREKLAYLLARVRRSLQGGNELCITQAEFQTHWATYEQNISDEPLPVYAG